MSGKGAPVLMLSFGMFSFHAPEFVHIFRRTQYLIPGTGFSMSTISTARSWLDCFGTDFVAHAAHTALLCSASSTVATVVGFIS